MACKHTPRGTVAMHVAYKYYTNMPINRLLVLKISLHGTSFDGIHTEICPDIVFSFSYSVRCYYRCTRKALHMCCTSITHGIAGSAMLWFQLKHTTKREWSVIYAHGNTMYTLICEDILITWNIDWWMNQIVEVVSVLFFNCTDDNQPVSTSY